MAGGFNATINFDTIPRNYDQQGREWLPIPGFGGMPNFIQNSLTSGGYSMDSRPNLGGLSVADNDLIAGTQDFEVNVIFYLEDTVNEQIVLANRGGASGDPGGNVDGQFIIEVYNNTFVFYLGSTGFAQTGGPVPGWNNLLLTRTGTHFVAKNNGTQFATFDTANNFPFSRWTVGQLGVAVVNLPLLGWVDYFSVSGNVQVNGASVWPGFRSTGYIDLSDPEYQTQSVGLKSGIIELRPSDIAVNALNSGQFALIKSRAPAVRARIRTDGNQIEMKSGLPAVRAKILGDVVSIIKSGLPAVRARIVAQQPHGLTGNSLLPAVRARLVAATPIAVNIESALPAVRASIAGSAAIAADIKSGLPAVRASGYIATPALAMIESVLPAVRARIVGLAGYGIDVHSVLPAVQARIVGAAQIAVKIVSNLPAVRAQIIAQSVNITDVQSRLQAVRARIVAGITTQINGNVELPAFGASGEILVVNQIIGDLELPGISGEGMIIQFIAVSGNVELPGLGVEGEISSFMSINGDVELPAFGVTGEIMQMQTIVGEIELPAFGVVGLLRVGDQPVIHTGSQPDLATDSPGVGGGIYLGTDEIRMG